LTLRSVTSTGEAVPLAYRGAPPSVDAQFAVYPVIAEPPFEVGAVKRTDAVVPDTVAVGDVGAPGTQRGIALTGAHPPVRR
jgi:hypothetical protein